MKFLGLFAHFFIVYSICISAQIQNIPAENKVYEFLQKMKLKDIITDYDPTIQPLPNSQVVKLLKEIDSQRQELTTVEQEKVLHFIDKFDVNRLRESPSRKFLFNNPHKHLYSYSDSAFTFFINPIFSTDLIHDLRGKSSSLLFNLGGSVSASYDDWFGFFIQGTNGFQKGERAVALFKKEISQSYTFTNTGIDYFDNTIGYARFQSSHLSFQLGRDRILWGTGYINRFSLSDSPPVFDFIKFNFNYKSFTYDFIHGWLVRSPQFIPLDSISNAKIKHEKFIAINRLGFKASKNLSFGLSQAIIYADRSFEAAYLNPFLFWESAQRSLNDLDNSFLIFDMRYKPLKALEISSSLLIDDIDFEHLGDWDHIQNSYAFQLGIIVTDPILFENLTFLAEYSLIRPYVFSHRGYRESLSYSNNGYLLGIPFQPNSINVSFGIKYDISFNLDIDIVFSNTQHGANLYDSEGNLLTNYGGNFLDPFGFYQSTHVKILDGIRETTNEVKSGINYEIAYGLNLKFFNIFKILKSPSIKITDHLLFLGGQLTL